MSRPVPWIMAAGLSVIAIACGNQPNAPTTAATATPAAASPSAQRSTTSTHGESLTAVLGRGAGTVNVTPTAKVDGTFSAEITVNVHDAAPDTTFFVQRAPEIGRADSADGICQRALGLAPWGPPTPNFITFQEPNAGPPVTLLTSSGGAGVMHLAFDAPTIPDGLQFDVMFQLVDSLTVPQNELRSNCFTVTVK